MCTCVCVCVYAGMRVDARVCVFLARYTLCPHGHLRPAGRTGTHTGNYNEGVGLNPTDFVTGSRNSQEPEREPDAVGGNVNSSSFCGGESGGSSEN